MAVLIVVGFWMMLIGVVGIRMNLFPSKSVTSASFGDICLLILFSVGLLCWVTASVMFAFNLG